MPPQVVNQYTERPRPTLPRLELPEIDVVAEAREAAARVSERKVIRAGRDAWQLVQKSESFDGWLAIGSALQVGRTYALRASGSNQAIGRRYSRHFCEWINRHGFKDMAKSVRSVAIELAENAEAINAWREGLPERQRKRLVHPLSNVRRWRASTAPKPEADHTAKAAAAWRHFCACMQSLPADQAAPFYAQAATWAASCRPSAI